MMIWLNGQLLPADRARIDPRDRGFTLGDGLFETLCALDGHPLDLAAHLARLARGSTVLELPLPVEATEVATAISQVLEENGFSKGRATLRLTLSRGVGSRGLLMPLDPKPNLVITAGSFPQVPSHFDAATVPIRRNEGSPLSRIKSLNYLDNVLAQQQAQGAGAQEALMLNNRGRIAGFARGNLFALIGDTWVTPPLADGVLDGITRAKILKNAEKGGIDLSENSLERADIDLFRGLFITNSLLGCVPIARLDGREMRLDPVLADRITALSID
ncbi:aminotransferase class IV [Dongia sp.]|uniref:aminotransferase class IV n=1 Tax=Dongia sp. TaxID=1977262 RepID=UPI0035B06FB7